MFELLTRILLWLLIGTILWYVFSRFIPRAYLTWLGGIIVFIFVILAFLDPSNRTVGSVWGLLSLPLKPLGLAIFLLLSALKDGTNKVVGNQVLAALLVLLFSSTPIVANWLTSQAERTGMNSVALQAVDPNAQTTRAIVVLGDETDPASPSRIQPGASQNGFTSGLLTAGQLYQAQVSQGNRDLVVIASVGTQVNANDPRQPEAVQTVQSVLTSAGVPSDRILIETEGIDLRSSAIEVDRVLQARGFRKDIDTIVLVAPRLSIGRAIAALGSVGIRATPDATDRFLNGDRLLATVNDLVPNVGSLAQTTRVVDEYLTSVYYFLRGWLVNSR